MCSILTQLYNQGEDRWLCTLVIKRGWRIEYVAVSHQDTNAPLQLKEFFNQRRRWGPSTVWFCLRFKERRDLRNVET